MDEECRVEITCRDGVSLGGHLWTAGSGKVVGRVVINPATGVLARYYHRYARYLSEHGFDVLTYDYRGIGASRPAKLRGCGYRWRDWGELDFDAALGVVRDLGGDTPILVVGHSIGGFLPGLASNAALIDRMLTVGAQYAYWRDYAQHRRLALFLRWHVAMPALTALFGYFPGRRLGWLEDLPAGVANEWSFRRARMELSHPPARRQSVLASFAAIRAPTLAVTASDDVYASETAVLRAHNYYVGADKTFVVLSPDDLGVAAIGHFDLFHARHEETFWSGTLSWLRDGVNPWKPWRSFAGMSHAARREPLANAVLDFSRG